MSTPLPNVTYYFTSATRTWDAPGRPSLVGSAGLFPSDVLYPSETLYPSGD